MVIVNWRNQAFDSYTFGVRTSVAGGFGVRCHSPKESKASACSPLTPRIGDGRL